MWTKAGVVRTGVLLWAITAPAAAEPLLSGFTSEPVAVGTYALGATVVGGGGFGPASGRLSATRPQFTDLTVTRTSDASSPLFLKDLVQGQGKKATLSVAMEDPASDVTIKMEGARVQSYQVSGESTQLESITIGFTKIQVQVGAEKFCWDIVRAMPCENPL
jgi:hypothetical protein